MKHHWQDMPSTVNDALKHGWEPRRQCLNCGIIQQRETDHLWMRVVGYKWRPLAGRCKGPCWYKTACKKVLPAFKCPQECGGPISYVVRNYFVRGNRHLFLCQAHGEWYTREHSNVEKLP